MPHPQLNLPLIVITFVVYVNLLHDAITRS